MLFSRTVVADATDAQLFGYDVLVDENLRPWLLEVNASPSLGASNRDDLRLKKQMVGDVFDIIDIEGRLEKGPSRRDFCSTYCRKIAGVNRRTCEGGHG